MFSLRNLKFLNATKDEVVEMVQFRDKTPNPNDSSQIELRRTKGSEGIHNSSEEKEKMLLKVKHESKNKRKEKVKHPVAEENGEFSTQPENDDE